MNQFTKGYEAAKREIYKQFKELSERSGDTISKHNFEAVTEVIPTLQHHPAKAIPVGKAGIYIVGYWTREQMGQIGLFVDRMKELGFTYIELESTGNGSTGYIFEECQLHKDNGFKPTN